MRNNLKHLRGKRKRFYGTFSTTGNRWGWYADQVEMLCLQNVMNDEVDLVTDHVWMKHSNEFKELSLENGDQICFSATVVPYKKGYRGSANSGNGIVSTQDYTLSAPSDVYFIGTDKSLLDK